MNGYYAYTPTIWPSFFTTVLLIALAVYSWRRRSVPGALPFMVACLFAALWAAGSVMEYAAVDVATKIFWVKFQAAWQLPAVTAVTCFILEYTWPGRWLTRRNLVLLSIPPILVLALILTNNLHHLVWRSFAFNAWVTLLRGPAVRPLFAYGYALGLLDLVVLGWLFLHSPTHRWPVVVMLVGQVGARLIDLPEATSAIRSSQLTFVLGMSFVFLMYAVALFGFRLFDPMPLARQTVISQMREGMLVLDLQERVVSLNPAAEQMLQVSANHAKGRPIRELLSSYSDLNLDVGGRTVIEFNFPEACRDGLGEGQAIRDFTLGISQMKDWRGLEIGRLLLLRDVTEPKRARELQKQQQLLLTVLQERERLARELHDSLGQTLAAAHIQASTARVLLAQGETAQTDECLQQMADMTLAAEADVREYLLGAKTAFSPDRPFFVSLREYVARFSGQYDLQVEVGVPPQLETQGLGAAVEVQLLRIIQEALSNVRKHARAKNIQVIFSVSKTFVEVAIIDDGQGFDSALVAQQSERFGLQAMRERAETLGGCFEVISQPGQGTQVVVQVPVKGEGGRGEVIR